MTEPTPAAERPPRRWTQVLLVASLGFNLVILGLAGGHEISRALYGPRMPVRDLGFGPFTQALSPDDRRDLLRDFMRQNKDFGAQREAMRSDFRTLLAALKNDPYDPATFAAVMARQKARTDEWLALGQQLLTDRIAQMTPAERTAFADRLQDQVARHRHGPPPGPKPDPKPAAPAAPDQRAPAPPPGN